MARPVPSVLSALRRRLPPGAALVLAVSGGRDSVALLHGAAKLRRVLKLSLFVAHFDHRLRSTSANDCRFVEQLAADYELPFIAGVPQSTRGRENMEAWARRERYRFLETVRILRAADWVVTAHHADDVAETFLMRVLGNREFGGITGIDSKRKLLRPMLDVPRSCIERFAEESQLRWVEDESNADTDRLRNKVRHVLLPFLRSEFEPRITEWLAQRAAAVHEDLEGMDAEALNCIEPLHRLQFGSRGWVRALNAMLNDAPDYRRWRLVEQAFFPKLGQRLGRAHANVIVGFFLERRLRAELPGSRCIERVAGGISIISHRGRRSAE